MWRSDRPSGELPVWGMTVALFYYPAQQRWYSTASVYEQADGDAVYHHDHELSWGPFDTAFDALTWAHRELDHAMALPRAPWGSVTG